MFEVDVKNMTKGRGGGPAQVWGSDEYIFSVYFHELIANP